MDEIDVKRALRGYVTSDMPPFGLKASDLVAQGRRRELRRAGWVSLGSAGMAGLVAFAATAVTTPLSDSNRVAPPGFELNVTGCDRPLPLGGWPVVPSGEVPTTEPTRQTASGDPTAYPFRDPSNDPTKAASSYPTTLASFNPAALSSDYPSALASDYPTALASDYPTASASDLPSGQAVEETRWPSVPPDGPLPADPDPAKVEAMACYIRGAAVVLLPRAGFAPASEPPMQPIRWTELDFVTGWEPVYCVRAFAIEGQRNGMFAVYVRPLPRATRTPVMSDVDIRPLGGGRTAYIERGTPITSVRVDTAHTSIVVSFDGMLTVEQALALAAAPELDLFS